MFWFRENSYRSSSSSALENRLPTASNFLEMETLTQVFSCEFCEIIATHKGRQGLLSACLSTWTESHKICKVWALINLVLPRCFRSYGLWLTRQINHEDSWYQRVNRYSNWNVNFHLRTHNSIFSTHLRKVCHSNKWNGWHLCCSILKLLMVIQQL